MDPDVPADKRAAASAFRELFHQVFLAFHERLTPGERPLGFEALGVLEHLDATGPLSIQECAAHFARSQAATSEIVARLRRRGLLESVPDARDRRRHLVWLTPDGLAALDRARRVLSAERLDEAFARQSGAECTAAVHALETLLRHAPEPAGGSGSNEPS